MPPADQGFAALLEDLDARGLLDETLVVWVGSLGQRRGSTRPTAAGHWPQRYSAVLAGERARGLDRRRIRPLGRISCTGSGKSATTWARLFACPGD